MERNSPEFREHLKRIGFKIGNIPKSKGRPFQEGHRTNVGKKRTFTEEHRKNISITNKGKRLNPAGEFQKGHIPWSKGKKMSEETRKKISENKERGNKISRALKGRKFSAQSKRKMSEAQRRRNQKGNKNPNWKGGVTPLNRLLRKGWRYQQWRSKVFERDNWICQTCGRRGCRLEAHHIKSWAKYPELRFDIDNGVTLCCDCHKLTRRLTLKKGDKGKF